jgi:hypothetical protein
MGFGPGRIKNIKNLDHDHLNWSQSGQNREANLCSLHYDQLMYRFRPSQTIGSRYVTNFFKVTDRRSLVDVFLVVLPIRNRYAARDPVAHHLPICNCMFMNRPQLHVQRTDHNCMSIKLTAIACL